MLVAISCYCDNQEHNWESCSLVFKTIRVGFPTAQILVCITGTKCHDELISLCKKENCSHQLFPPQTTNDEIARYLVNTRDITDLILLDSDLVFWDSVESFKAEQLISGRFIPKHLCQFTGYVTQSRLHTSFLWIKDTLILRETISQLKPTTRFAPLDVFSPFLMADRGQFLFYDSLANLYHCLGGESFEVAMLNKYDHLFAGSFAKQEAKRSAFMASLYDKHAEVYRDIQKAKGLWKEQEQYFLQYAVK